MLNNGPAHHFFTTSSTFMKCSKDILNCGFAWDAILLLVSMDTKRSHKPIDIWHGSMRDEMTVCFEQQLGIKKEDNLIKEH